MNYPVRLYIQIADKESGAYFVVMRGHLIAEPRVGGFIQIPNSIEMDGPLLEIDRVEEDLERHWLEVHFKIPEDMSFAGDYKDDPEKVIEFIEQALSRCGWYAIGPDGTANSRNEW